MRAKSLKPRQFILSEGTRLIPTFDFVDITEGEAKHPFTLALAKAKDIELEGEVVKGEEVTAVSDRVKELIDGNNLKQLETMASNYDIEVPSKATKAVLAGLIFEFETEYAELIEHLENKNVDELKATAALAEIDIEPLGDDRDALIKAIIQYEKNR